MKKEISFRTWLEGWQEFGFEKDVEREDSHNSLSGRPDLENPVDTFDIEYMRNMLCERNLGTLQPSSFYVNEITWGSRPNQAVRLLVNPVYGLYMERLGVDLKGAPRWYVKKYLQINRQGYGGYEEVVTQEVYDHLKDIHDAEPDQAQGELEDFQGLVIHMAERIKAVMRPIFLMEQIRKVHDHRYIISLVVRGQGVQAPDQKQVFRNLTEVNFYPDQGVIRVFNTSADSKVGRSRTPVLSPSHCDMIHMPTQSWDEIADPIATLLRFY